MDDATRAEAHKKLATFDPRVGYPVKWRDYSAYDVEPGKLFESVRNGRRFEWNRQVARLGEPVDRDEWGMNPQTVNAYYNPLVNQITFPAAILQPPFFDPYADPAVNYGAIGAVIGHEMGHGYDDQGREFDETGKIRNWWTPETNDEFMAAIGEVRGAVQRVLPARGRLRERQLHDGREHRRPRRPRNGVHGLQAVARRPRGARHRRLHGRPAVLHGARPGLARDPARDALRKQMLADPHSPAARAARSPSATWTRGMQRSTSRKATRNTLPPDERVRIW